MTSPSSQHRQAGRPTASLLTPHKITSTAQALMAKQGDFTMSQLAKKLGVAPSSLYNHVSSRAEVLAGISDAVARGISTQELVEAARQVREGELEAGRRQELWKQATGAWARSYRRAFSVSPAVVATLAVTPVRQAPATLAMYEQVADSFVAFGMNPRQALLTIEALEAFLLGSATDIHAPIDIYDPGDFSGQAPTVAQGYSTLGDTPQDQAFELGLAALLAGFSATL